MKHNRHAHYHIKQKEKENKHTQQKQREVSTCLEGGWLAILVVKRPSSRKFGYAYLHKRFS